MKRDRRPESRRDLVEVDKDSLLQLFTPIWQTAKPWLTSPVLWIVLAVGLIPLPLFNQAYMAVFLLIGVINVGLGIWLLFVALEESWICAVMVWLVPFYVVYYVITRWESHESGNLPFKFFLIAVFGDIYLTVAYILYAVIHIGAVE